MTDCGIPVCRIRIGVLSGAVAGSLMLWAALLAAGAEIWTSLYPGSRAQLLPYHSPAIQPVLQPSNAIQDNVSTTASVLNAVKLMAPEGFARDRARLAVFRSAGTAPSS